MSMDSQSTDVPDLCLPLSGLSVKNGKILRHDSSGAQIAALNIESIKEVGCRRSVDWGIVFFVMLCLIGILIVALCSISRPWNLIIVVPLGLIAFFALFGGGIETELIVISESGRVTFPVLDAPSDAKAFTVSLRERLPKGAEQTP